MNGTIARLVRDKGFGFIRGEDGQDRFFHRSGVGGSTRFEDLDENMRVSFEHEESGKGPRATDVRAA